MILRILLLASAVLIAPSIAKMDLSTFLKKFEDKCFQNEDKDPFRVNGQESPLSSTMDNFIAMAEKFEVANPNVDLKDELNYFISEYLFENIKITSRRISEIPIERVRLETVDTLWDHDTYRPEFQDPFSDDEQCSLYFMISHSILAKDTALMRSYGNDSTIFRTDLNPEEYYPQELGVVAVKGTDGPVSLSKVLLGLYVGLQPNRKTELKSLNLHFRDEIQQDRLDLVVDPLYSVTMAEALMLSSWEGFERKGLAKFGKWVSIPLGEERIEGFCPMVYKQEIPEGTKILPAYSIASVRGAADGLILGLTASKIYSTEAKLSQILRMYYSPRGIVVQENIEDINLPQVSLCTRDKVIQILEQKVLEQMIAYGYLIAISQSDIDKSYAASKTKYEENKYAIYQTKVENGFCTPPTTLEKPEDLPVETFLDVIVVMDTSNTPKNFLDQQLITGYLAKQLDLKYSGSRITILMDHKINSVSTSGSPSRIQLKPVVNGTYSSSCASCTVGQLPYEQSTVPREDVVIAVDQLLQQMKDDDKSLNGDNGKVVIYFNYENGDGRTNNNRVQDKVDRALRDLNIRHQDVLLYAVGLDSEILLKYARDDPSLIFLGSDDKPEEVADKIFKKISFAPGILQYTDCMEAKNEKAATYESFVSPNKVQHYFMPAEYFYKSFTAKVMFESQDGLIRVCFNRATMKPENEAKHCKETTATSNIEFKISNPCKSFTKERCSPLYFAIMGKDPTAENGNQVQRQRSTCKSNDRLCSTLDQIKFKVSHDGIRCSGCLGLGAPPAIILFTVLLTYFLYKRI